jgi:hypothetical protein
MAIAELSEFCKKPRLWEMSATSVVNIILPNRRCIAGGASLVVWTSPLQTTARA